MKRIYGVPALFLTLVGCVTYKIPVDMDASKPVGFTLVDNRPESDRIGRTHSRLVSDCGYGITDIGDADLEPSKLVLLKTRLQRELGGKLDGKVITVDRFKIVRNSQLALRQRAASSAGLIGNLLATGNCVASPEVEGAYALEDNPKGLPSITVIVVGTVGSAKFRVKHFETGEKPDDLLPIFSGNILPRVLDGALKKVIAEIQSQI